MGDFDSAGDLSDVDKIFPRSVLHELKDQKNSTDFEKALNWLKDRDLPQKVVILGGLGKRMDHTLSNLMIAARVDKAVKIVFDDLHEFVSRITPKLP